LLAIDDRQRHAVFGSVTVPPATPGPGVPDPFGTLVAELARLYTAAGRPAYRRVSAAIARNDDMPDTVSHETVGAIVRGEGLSKWVKVECVVRQLAVMAVHRPDPDDEVQRFHGYWVTADDQMRNGRVPMPGPTDPPGPPGPADLPDFASDFVVPATAPEPAVLAGAVGAGRSAGPAPTRAAPPAAGDPRSRRTPSEDRSPASLGQLSGTVPYRSPAFTGRADLLELIRVRLGGEPWRPLALHGLGGVGKTRLALEYVHREAARYDLIHWISAEQPDQARMALAALGERLQLPASQDPQDTQQTVRAVLSRLESGDVPWLLVFDNANAPEDIEPLLPAAGGHVLITSRDAAWRDAARAVEVDVFTRSESIELLRHRGKSISFDEADQIAGWLGDLPLALEQVAAMQSATAMPAAEYLRQLAEHRPGILAEGQPRDYPATVAAVFGIAYRRLRNEAAVSAQLLELLSCLGAEPVSLSLLRSGRDVPPPLGRILDRIDPLHPAVRRLSRYGLVKVDEPAQAVEVHRLVQRVVRDELTAPALSAARASARRLLATANPGDPDSPTTWELHRRIGPHLVPSGIVGDESEDARVAVLDQIRYLWAVGEYAGSRRLGEQALAAWAGRGDDEHQFVCERHLTAALLASGEYEEAERSATALLRRLAEDPRYGPDHSLTIYTTSNVALLHRVFGRYRQALAVEHDRVEQYTRLRGPDHPRTLWVRNNLAVCLRLLGRFEQAYEIDSELAEARRAALGHDHPDTLLSSTNLARDLYGLGRYGEALETLDLAWPTLVDRLGSRHTITLLAARTIAIALRKTGRIDDALVRSREHYLQCQGQYGPDHQHTLAGTLTYANALRAAGHAAGHLATEAVNRYSRRFGKRHPLSLAAATILAATMRDAGEGRKARQVDEMALTDLRSELGKGHPYTLAAGVGLAADLVMVREEETARSLLERVLDDLREARGARHPDTLTCGVNLGLLLREQDTGTEVLAESLTALREVLGAGHPQVLAAQQGRRGDCEIEPPPG
jgi:tetratricopeptide (TPR) repeat protein